MTPNAWPRYVQWVGGLMLFEILSWLGFLWPPLMTASFVAMAAIGFWLAWQRPAWLAWLTLVELVVGGKGYLLSLSFGPATLSLRLLLFCLLFLATVLRAARRGLDDWRGLRPVGLGALLIWVVATAAWGWWRGNGLGAVFFDVNGFLYLLIFFMWWPFRRLPGWVDQAVVVLLAGVSVLAIKSWLAVLLFAHDIPSITTFYRWIRSTGIGEITFISKNVYRVFFQSHLYAVLVMLLTFGGLLSGRAPRWWVAPFFFSALAAYISLSRSLWLGLGAGFLALAVFGVARRNWRRWSAFLLLAPTAVGVWLAMSWALHFPAVLTPIGAPGPSDVVISRLRSVASRQAASARVNQIQPLLRAIRRHPIIGSGFGTTVTYFSTDPRVRGWRTTAAFELGYLDLWLKIGLVGLVLYGWWIGGIWRRLRRSSSLWFLTGGLVAVLVTHLTTPYLNHPLGLGWLALVGLLSYDSA